MEANTVLELSAVQFVKTRAKYVASCMGKQFDPRRGEAAQKLQKLVLESPEREEKVEMYLQRRILTTDLAGSLGPHDMDYQDIQDPNPESGYEGSETEAAQQPRFKNLEEVKPFILTSSAMTTLREVFRHFASQEQSKTQKLSPSAASHQEPLPESLAHNDLPFEKKDADSIDSFKDDEGNRRPRSLPRFVCVDSSRVQNDSRIFGANRGAAATRVKETKMDMCKFCLSFCIVHEETLVLQLSANLVVPCNNPPFHAIA